MRNGIGKRLQFPVGFRQFGGSRQYPAFQFGLRLPDAQLAVGLDDAHRDACLRALALHGTKR